MSLKDKMKKRTYSCLEKRRVRFENPVEKIDEYQRACTDQGMELLRKWIRCLWD